MPNVERETTDPFPFGFLCQGGGSNSLMYFDSGQNFSPCTAQTTESDFGQLAYEDLSAAFVCPSGQLLDLCIVYEGETYCVGNVSGTEDNYPLNCLQVSVGDGPEAVGSCEPLATISFQSTGYTSGNLCKDMYYYFQSYL